MSMDKTDDARFTRLASALKGLPPGQPSRTLDLLARMRALTDQEMHERTGREMSRATINHKRSGRSPIRTADLWPLAEAVEVDVDVLLLPPSAAARWLAEHRASELDGAPPGGRPGYRCTGPSLNLSLRDGGLVGAGIPVRWAA